MYICIYMCVYADMCILYIHTYIYIYIYFIWYPPSYLHFLGEVQEVFIFQG